MIRLLSLTVAVLICLVTPTTAQKNEGIGVVTGPNKRTGAVWGSRCGRMEGVDQVVCDHSELSAKHDELSSAIRRLVFLEKARGEKDRIEKEHSECLVSRENCQRNIACLLKMYDEQVLKMAALVEKYKD
jgi:hypothetical protein